MQGEYDADVAVEARKLAREGVHHVAQAAGLDEGVALRADERHAAARHVRRLHRRSGLDHGFGLDVGHLLSGGSLDNRLGLNSRGLLDHRSGLNGGLGLLDHRGGCNSRGLLDHRGGLNGGLGLLLRLLCGGFPGSGLFRGGAGLFGGGLFGGFLFLRGGLGLFGGLLGGGFLRSGGGLLCRLLLLSGGGLFRGGLLRGGLSLLGGGFLGGGLRLFGYGGGLLGGGGLRLRRGRGLFGGCSLLDGISFLSCHDESSFRLSMLVGAPIIAPTDGKSVLPGLAARAYMPQWSDMRRQYGAGHGA